MRHRWVVTHRRLRRSYSWSAWSKKIASTPSVLTASAIDHRIAISHLAPSSAQIARSFTGRTMQCTSATLSRSSRRVGTLTNCDVWKSVVTSACLSSWLITSWKEKKSLTNTGLLLLSTIDACSRHGPVETASKRNGQRGTGVSWSPRRMNSIRSLTRPAQHLSQPRMASSVGGRHRQLSKAWKTRTRTLQLVGFRRKSNEALK